MCKRRIAETLHLTIKSTGKLARLSVGTGSDFYETVKRNFCLKLAHRALSEKRYENFFVAESLPSLMDSPRNRGNVKLTKAI